MNAAAQKASAATSIVDALPDAETVRQQLVHHEEEAAALRGVLRLLNRVNRSRASRGVIRGGQFYETRQQ